MRAKFTCLLCRTETEFGSGGELSLCCQSCGSLDIRFKNDVVLTPYNIGSGKGIEVLIRAGESFFGRHKGGKLWTIVEIIDTNKQEEPKEEPVKEEPIKEEFKKEEEKKEKVLKDKSGRKISPDSVLHPKALKRRRRNLL